MKSIYFIEDLLGARSSLKLFSDATINFRNNTYSPMPNAQIITELSPNMPITHFQHYLTPH